MNIFLIDNSIPFPVDHVTLNPEESAHCIRVLRHREGEEISMVDGAGGFYKGVITDANPKACAVKITEHIKDYGRRNYKLHVAIAPTKNIDRFEWFLEKATEIGIDEITPIICHHSERREVKTERLNKVIVAAVKQSIKAYMPMLHPAVSFRNFVPAASASCKMICHVEAGSNSLLKNIYTKGADALVLIGPEGDFSEEELKQALNHGFKPTSLGDTRLRTETAGVVACSAVQLLNQ